MKPVSNMHYNPNKLRCNARYDVKMVNSHSGNTIQRSHFLRLVYIAFQEIDIGVLCRKGFVMRGNGVAGAAPIKSTVELVEYRVADKKTKISE